MPAGGKDIYVAGKHVARVTLDALGDSAQPWKVMSPHGKILGSYRTRREAENASEALGVKEHQRRARLTSALKPAPRARPSLPHGGGPPLTQESLNRGRF